MRIAFTAPMASGILKRGRERTLAHLTLNKRPAQRFRDLWRKSEQSFQIKIRHQKEREILNLPTYFDFPVLKAKVAKTDVHNHRHYHTQSSSAQMD
tara:strand:+ start:1190 stop:1477 length:288 start_codon:yes stop_codon:yes gene_type:complete